MLVCASPFQLAGCAKLSFDPPASAQETHLGLNRAPVRGIQGRKYLQAVGLGNDELIKTDPVLALCNNSKEAISQESI